MSGIRHAGLIALGLLGAGVRGDPMGDRAEALYRPFLADQMALATDGKHVAYTRHTDDGISVVIMEVDDPSKKSTLMVQGDRDVAFSNQKEASQLRLLRWASADRLVFAPTEQTAPGGRGFGPKITSPIFAVNADGTHAGEIASARDFASFRLSEGNTMTDPIPWMRPLRFVGLWPGKPSYLLVEGTGLSGVPTTLFKLDVVTGKFSTLAEEQVSGKVVYDWQGHIRVVAWQIAREMTRTFSHLSPTFVGKWQDIDENGAGRRRGVSRFRPATTLASGRFRWASISTARR